MPQAESPIIQGEIKTQTAKKRKLIWRSNLSEYYREKYDFLLTELFSSWASDSFPSKASSKFADGPNVGGGWRLKFINKYGYTWIQVLDYDY